MNSTIFVCDFVKSFNTLCEVYMKQMNDNLYVA